MNTSKPTLPFRVELRDGTTLSMDAENLEDLRETTFASPAEFDEKTAAVSWKEKSTLCIYNVDTKKITRQIADADVNPFGWRQQHR